MERVLLAGLMVLDLPGRTVRLCDGAFVKQGADTFTAADDTFGVLAGFEALSEGVGDEAPAGTITMLPPSTAAAAALSQPGFQGARMRLMIAEIDEATAEVIGTPDVMADWQLDRTTLKIRRGSRSLEMGCVTRAQRLMIRNEGNSLSSPFHSSIFTGEAGFDNAVGLEMDVAWGVASAPRGTTASSTSA